MLYCSCWINLDARLSLKVDFIFVPPTVAYPGPGWSLKWKSRHLLQVNVLCNYVLLDLVVQNAIPFGSLGLCFCVSINLNSVGLAYQAEIICLGELFMFYRELNF